jgi:hypothetical protein
MTLNSGRRPVRRPRWRWLDTVDRDAKRMLKCKNWRRLAKDRYTWRWGIEDAKTRVDLCRQRRKRRKRRRRRM